MIQLNDPALFGKDDAETETPEVLASYFVDKDVFKSFRNPEVRLSLARCRKGIGKSALLSRTAYLVGKEDSDCLVVQLRGSDLVAQRPSPESRPDVLLYDWQQRVCTAILHRIGRDIDPAISDDAMSIVESSELAGFRQRNIFRALVDRLTAKAAGSSADLKRIDVRDSAQTLVLWPVSSVTYLIMRFLIGLGAHPAGPAGATSRVA